VVRSVKMRNIDRSFGEKKSIKRKVRKGRGPLLELQNNLWGARNRVGIGLSYWAARLHRLAESIPWNRFLGSIKV
jgi:hypothetical protein